MVLFGHEEFRLTYQNQLDVIQGLKDKSWRASHYSVLAQASVYAIYVSIECPSTWTRTCAAILCVVVFAWTLFIVHNLQGGIYVRRKATETLRRIDPEVLGARAFDDVWKETKAIKPPVWCDVWARWKNDGPIGCAYTIAIIVPPLVVTGLIYGWWV
jgi:hypothetical protein